MADEQIIQKMAEVEEKLKEALRSPDIQRIRQIQQEKANLIRQLKEQLIEEVMKTKTERSREVRIGNTIYWVELVRKEKLREDKVKEFLKEHGNLTEFVEFEREYKLKKKQL